MFSSHQMNVLYKILITIGIILLIYLGVILYPFYQTVLSFLWKLFLPFIVASFLAYLLYPTIKKLQEHGMPKTFAILLIYILFFGSISFGIYKGFPMIVQQLKEFKEQLPQIISMYEELILLVYESTSFLPETVHDHMDQLIYRMEATVEEMVGNVLGHITKVVDFILFIAVIPVLVFYMLKDFQRIKRGFKYFVPQAYMSETTHLFRSIDQRLGQYIRGQLLVSFFVSLATLIAFHLLNINYALLLAIIMGITNIIPYFGPIIGLVPVIAITITVSYKKVIVAVIAVLVIQILESNFLSPYIVGKSINTHPITIIFVLLLGGQLLGVVGMIIAVPALTIFKEILAYYFSLKATD